MKKYTKMFEDWQQGDDWDEEALLAYEALMQLGPAEVGRLVSEDPNLWEIATDFMADAYTEEEMEKMEELSEEELGSMITSWEKLHVHIMQEYADALAGMGMFDGMTTVGEAMRRIRGLL